MLFRYFTAAAVIGLTQARVVAPAEQKRDACSSNELSGEVVRLSLQIVEYPFVLNAYYSTNTVVNVADQVTITVTNAPTYLRTTIPVTIISTVTTTISTATVTIIDPAA
jgi:hypothetical protein